MNLSRYLRTVPLLLLILSVLGGVSEVGANQIVSPAITVTNTTTSALAIPKSSGLGMVLLVNVTAIGGGDTWTFKAQYLDSSGNTQDLTSTSGNVTGTGFTALTLAAPFSLGAATPTPSQIVATRTVNGGTPTITYTVTSIFNGAAGPLSPSPKEILVIPSQGGAGIQAACTAAKAAATSTSPVTIRLVSGIYSSDAQINCADMNYVSLIGAGMDQTIIQATATFLGVLNGADTDFLELGNTRNGVMSGITVDEWTTDPLTYGATTHLGGAIHQCITDSTGVFTFDGVHTYGPSYGWWCASGASATAKIYTFRSKFEAHDTALRIGGEHWFGFDTELRATDPNESTAYLGTNVGVTPGATGLSLSATANSDWWACHIHGESKKTTTSWRASGISYGMNSSTALNTFSGCTIHSVSSSPSADTSTTDTGGLGGAIQISGVATVSGTININGSQLIYKTPTGQVGLRAGGVSCNSTSASGVKVYINGGAFIDDGGTTVATKVNSIEGQRGDIVYTKTSGTPPTIQLNGVRRIGGVSSAINFSTLTGPDSWTNGSLTLSSGAAIISWITDAGAAGGTPVFSTASASVTGGTAIDTTFMPGQFIRIGTDPVPCFTRIKSVDSSTALTLVESYGGGRTGCTSATAASNQGTLTANTTPDSSFRVTLLPTSAPAASEVFYTIDKFAGGFTAKSSSGASTLTLDYTVSR